MTPIEWLLETLERNDIVDLDTVDSDKYRFIIKEAKRREEEREYETKCYWFGRGINAAKTNGIGKLKPKRIDQ